MATPALPRLHTGGGHRPVETGLGANIEGSRRRPPDRHDDALAAPRAAGVEQTSPMPGMHPSLQSVSSLRGSDWRQTQEWSSPHLAGCVGSWRGADPQATPSRRSLQPPAPIDDAKLQGCLNILQQLAGALPSQSPEVDFRRSGGFQPRGPGVRQSASLPSLTPAAGSRSIGSDQADCDRRPTASQVDVLPAPLQNPADPWAPPWNPNAPVDKDPVRGSSPVKRGQGAQRGEARAAPWPPKEAADHVLGTLKPEEVAKAMAPASVYPVSPNNNNALGAYPVSLSTSPHGFDVPPHGAEAGKPSTQPTQRGQVQLVNAAPQLSHRAMPPQASMRMQADVDAQTYALAERHAHAQADVQVRAHALAQAHVAAQAHVDAQATALAKAQAEAEAQADALARARAQAEAHAKAQAELEAQAQALAQAQAQAQAHAEAHAKAQAEVEAQAQALYKAQAQAQAAHAHVSFRGNEQNQSARHMFDVKPFASGNGSGSALQPAGMQPIGQGNDRAPMPLMRKSMDAPVHFFKPFASNMQPLAVGNDRQPVSPLHRGLQKSESMGALPGLSFPTLRPRGMR